MEINDWTLAGGGMEGESYTSASRPDLIMKVYAEGCPQSFVDNEFAQVQALRQCGISTPQALEVTHHNGRPAIISQRVANKKSFCRLAGEEPDLIAPLAERMAHMVKELHATTSTDYAFTSATAKYQQLLRRNTILDAAAKQAVQDAIESIASDDRATLLHGDMHFGNIITDGLRDYFIDLGDLSHGNPNHDLAMFYITTHYGSDHSFRYLYHLSWQQALQFWDLFKTNYYGCPVADQELLPTLKPYMLARAVWFKEPQIQTALCSLLCQQHSPTVGVIKLKALGEL